MVNRGIPIGYKVNPTLPCGARSARSGDGIRLADSPTGGVGTSGGLRLLGGVRLRQLRVLNGSCAVAEDHKGAAWDSLVVVSATLLLAIVSLSTGAPRPSWLVALPGAPEWRALPYVLPAVAHGCQLAICWLLGAFAASAFEKGAYMDGWQEALRRCWRAGSPRHPPCSAGLPRCRVSCLRSLPAG